MKVLPNFEINLLKMRKNSMILRPHYLARVIFHRNETIPFTFFFLLEPRTGVKKKKSVTLMHVVAQVLTIVRPSDADLIILALG